ncbi:hypothetical protein GCM10009550_49530 [Actinocorallia libanotica]|uniref:Carbon monoxide dehydrogenase subunit G n=2 Tax=Actinocorallia libanotica TaxID=46162 RepID=A0ABP4C3L8_9ACTN
MELDHEFTVATDADTAWPVLLDVERLHPLMPGAVYESGSDGEYRGRLKVKFGPTTITYRGTVRLAVVDDLTRTAILEVSAREARGQGTVTGSFQAVVLPATDSSARVALHTRLTFTEGRAATLGASLVHDTGAKLLTRFAANLNTLLTTAPEPKPVRPEPITTEPERAESAAPTEPEPIVVEIEQAAPAATAEPGPIASAEPEPIAAEPERAEPVAAAEPEPVVVERAEPLVSVETVEAEVSVEARSGAAGRVAERGGDDALELYELTERAGRLRRVLPLVGVLVLLLVVARRLVRRD